MQRFFKIVLFILLLMAGVGTLAIYWTFYRPLPDYSTDAELTGLHQPVHIKWDSYGVPHIYARNEHDLYMALGYAHAQDRLWQMTLSQMAAQGRFAEFLGKDLIPLDKLQRTIGFWRIAQKMEAQLPDSTRRILQAYADGVNQYTAHHKKELPIQFSLVGMKPIRWMPAHSLALARLMAWELNISWKSELTYSLLFDTLGRKSFKELFPNPAVSSNLPGAEPNSSVIKSAATMLKLDKQYRRLRKIEGHHTGSNAWAVSGAKTHSGKPLLAGDPHLGLSIPGKWYEVHLNLNGRNLSGATLPGAPSVVLGQNDMLAWSFTNVMLDDTDFFEEQLDPHDSSQYMLDSLAGKPVYKKFRLQHEVIKVKDGDDRSFTRKLTNHGPVISDIYPKSDQIGNRIISMKWTGQQPTEELQALQMMGWAHSFDAFRQGVRKFKNPAQNIIYADTAGNIGLFTAASVPIREGNPILIRPGWKSESDWLGTVDYDDLPKIINPKKGWVANANNPVDENFPYYLSVYWQPDSRIRRIREYLSGNNQMSTEAFQVMQNDTYSDYAKSVTQIILPILQNREQANFSVAVNYLENWDYTYGESETAASIMDVFLLQLARNTLQDEMDPEVYKQFISYSAKPARLMLRLLRNGSSFFDDQSTTVTESRADIIAKSMHETLQFLKDKFGDEPSDWHWENLHTVTLNPPLFGRAAQDSSAPATLKLIVNNVLQKGPYPVGGNSMSINNGEYLWTNPFDMVVGPSIRRIVDLSDLRHSLSIIPGGQSGNPLSDYYNDQTQSWLNGQYKFLDQDSTQLGPTQKMTLRPAK